VTYRPHGTVPSDEDIARLGFKAFGPARPAFVPADADWERASRDLATGDPEELVDLAAEVAAYWPRDEGRSDKGGATSLPLRRGQLINPGEVVDPISGSVAGGHCERINPLGL
jgi:hypothetical protein